MSLGEDLRRNTLWVLFGDVGGRALGFVFGVVLARILMPEDFGLVVTVQILTGALGFLAAHGTGDALVRAKTLGPRDVGTVFSLQIIACLVIFALLNLIAPAFSAWFRDARLEDLLRLSAVTFLLRPFVSIPQSLLQRDTRFREISMLIVIGLVVGGIVSVTLALAGLGPWALVLGGLAGTVVRAIVTLRIARWVPAVAFDSGAAATLGVFGLKLSANDIIQFARTQTANAVVSRQLGVAQVGLFNKADSLAEIPYQMFSGSAYETLFRALASMQDNLDRCAYLFLRTITLICFYALPFYVGLMWVAEPMVITLYGAHWAGAGLPLQILAAAGLFRLIAHLCRAVAASHDRLGKEIFIQLETWGLLLAGILIGLHWGLAGVAIGTLPSFAYNAARMYLLAGSVLRIGPGDLVQALAPVLKLNVLLAVALALADQTLAHLAIGDQSPLYLALMVAVGGALYGGVFLLRPPRALASESARWRGQILSLVR